MQGLYAIVDATTLQHRNLPIVPVAGAIALARPAALQVRAKDMSARELLVLLRAIRPLCRACGVPLYANDRLDVAVLADCDGVHLGQDDLPLHVARRIAPQLRLGLSTHSLTQLDDAMLAGPDYVAYGPVFNTRSKLDPDQVVGIDGLLAARRRSRLPLVAIGGIDLERASGIAHATQLGAVIAALLPEGVEARDLSPITARARALHAALGGVSRERA